ncbi:MAG: TldD/PmbA family protein, partial [Deltaproteobacteria bacterium]|nr:TldD/PmbA family protein [Deltaproteobacteria bacterium]
MGLFEDFDPEKVLRKALKNGGELSEIYAEDTSTTSIVLEEDKIENILGGRDRGCGIRVIAGLKTFYAYTNSINEASLLELAEMVSAAVKNGQDRGDVHLKGKEVAPGFKIITPPGDVSLNDKVEL